MGCELNLFEIITGRSPLANLVLILISDGIIFLKEAAPVI